MQHQDTRSESQKHGFSALFHKLLAVCFCPISSSLDARKPINTERKNATLQRCAFVCLLFFIGFIGLFWQAFKVQVIDHEQFTKEVVQRITNSQDIVGKRGRVFDLNGNMLINSIATQSVFAEPKLFPSDPAKRMKLMSLLSYYLDIPLSKLEAKCRKVTEANVEVALKCTLTNDNAKIIDRWKLPAVTVTTPRFDEDNYQLVISPKACSPSELNTIVKQLSPLVGLSVKEINAQIKKALNRHVEITLSNTVEFVTAEKLRSELIKNKLKNNSIRITNESERCYTQGKMLSNLLGYLNKANKGVCGIEKNFESMLLPKSGKQIFETDAKGNVLANSVVKNISANNGADIYLTIQAPIQFIAEEALEKVVTKYSPERAYAVMMNPKTGAIMALAQYPTFNPNDRSTMKDPLACQAHCLGETYEPGSIMKAIPVSYALDKGIVTLDKMYYCEKGRWIYKGAVLNDTHRLENTSVSDILMFSSNIGTAKIALDIGESNLFEALRAFGFGKRTNLGFIPSTEFGKEIFLSSESSGRFRPLEKWDALSVTRFPIGQGISVTPLQMIQAYGALANNGIMMQPYIIDRIDFHNQVVFSQPKVKGTPISPKGAYLVTQALKTVVSKDGTGSRAAIDGYQVAGKTGTGQIWDSATKSYAAKYFTSSFVGYVPADNPAFVLLVSVRGVHVHGGTACGPVFKEIATKTLEYLQISPDKPQLKSEGTAKYTP